MLLLVAAAFLLVQVLPSGATHAPPPLPAGDLLPAYPRFHLSLARLGQLAINDPNGVQRLDDLWHYFFQCHDGSWGHPPLGTTGFCHVTSTDLLHWTLQPRSSVIVPGPKGSFDVGGVWSGGGFSTEDSAGERLMGLTYRAIGSGKHASGVAVAISRSAPGNGTTSWRKLGLLFHPPTAGDGMPIWRTEDGRWHGGGAIDTTASQRGRTVTYTSAPTSTNELPTTPTAWTSDTRSLLDVAVMAPNWPGNQCCCPDFVPASPPDTASPQPSNSTIWVT
jgi:hypothetical protein